VSPSAAGGAAAASVGRGLSVFHTQSLVDPIERIEPGLGELLDVDEVATRLAVQRASVYRLIREGELPALRVGRLWRIPLEGVRLFVRAGGSPR
jgi:excisionase family DNA binding protein